jgi:hypothetical protein
MAPSFQYNDIVNGTTVLFKRLNGKHLMVVYTIENNEINLVTTFITGALKRLLKER